MTKLTALIEAANTATPGPWTWPNVGSSDFVISGPDRLAIGHLDSPRTAKYIALANPTTILELCALLEKAEEALKCVKVYIPPSFANTHNGCNEALAAIKQWKEQT